jgi:hypothetical protein
LTFRFGAFFAFDSCAFIHWLSKIIETSKLEALTY